MTCIPDVAKEETTKCQQRFKTLLLPYILASPFLSVPLSRTSAQKKRKKLILPHFQIAQGPTFSSVLFVYILSPPHSSDRRRPTDQKRPCCSISPICMRVIINMICRYTYSEIGYARERGGGEKLRSIVGGGGLAIKSISVRYQRPLPLRRPSSIIGLSIKCICIWIAVGRKS